MAKQLNHLGLLIQARLWIVFLFLYFESGVRYRLVEGLKAAYSIRPELSSYTGQRALTRHEYIHNTRLLHRYKSLRRFNTELFTTQRTYVKKTKKSSYTTDLVLDDFGQICEALLVFKQAYGDMQITSKFEVPAEAPWPPHLHGLRLGKRLEKLLSNRDFYTEHPNLVDELAKHGFDPKVHSLIDDWDMIVLALKVYKKKFGDLRITARYQVPATDEWPRVTHGMKLGVRIAAIRSAGRYVKDRPERKQELEAMDFEWRLRDNTYSQQVGQSEFDQVLLALTIYKQRVDASMAVPISFTVPATAHWPEELHGFKLGAYIEGITNDSKRKLVFGHPDRIDALNKLDFKWKTGPVRAAESSRRFGVIYEAMLVYKSIYGDLYVPQMFVVPEEEPWPESTWKLKLGLRVGAIRNQGTFVANSPERRALLDQIGFDWELPSESRRRKKQEEQAAAKAAKAAKAAAASGIPIPVDDTADTTTGAATTTQAVGAAQWGSKASVYGHGLTPTTAAVAAAAGVEIGGGQQQEVNTDGMLPGTTGASAAAGAASTTTASAAGAGAGAGAAGSSAATADAKQAAKVSAQGMLRSIMRAGEPGPDAATSQSLEEASTASAAAQARRIRRLDELNDMVTSRRLPFDPSYMFAPDSYREISGEAMVSYLMSRDYSDDPDVRQTGHFEGQKNPNDFNRAITRYIPPEGVARMKERSYRMMEFGSYNWDIFYDALSIYAAAYGDVNVPLDFVVTESVLDEAVGFKEEYLNLPLGELVNAVRIGDHDGLEDPERRKQLQQVGFDWGDVRNYQRFRFPQLYQGLKVYKHLYGFPMPSTDFVVPDEPQWPYWMVNMPLGEWTAVVRVQQDMMRAKYPDRVDLLDAMEFLWWIPPNHTLPDKYYKPLRKPAKKASQ